jgi:hypothetical protein
VRRTSRPAKVPCHQGVSVAGTLIESGPCVGVAEDAITYRVGRRTVIGVEAVQVLWKKAEQERGLRGRW